MPSGYTHEIYEGKEVTAEEFLMKCARNFGATVTMRDEPLDKEIPEFKPDTYHLTQIEKKELELEKYLKMSPEEVDKQVEEEYQEAFSRYTKKISDYEQIRARYQRTLREIENWVPPTEDHVNLKQFAIQQIEDSMKWDCNFTHLKLPAREDIKEWLDTRILITEDSIKYHKKGWKEEVERTNGRNEWVKNLRESLKNL